MYHPSIAEELIAVTVWRSGVEFVRMLSRKGKSSHDHGYIELEVRNIQVCELRLTPYARILVALRGGRRPFGTS